MQAIFRQPGKTIHYTPGSAVAAGSVVMVGVMALVAERDIAANVQGDLATSGVFQVAKDTSVFAAGDVVYWNPTADPVGGVAGTGAASSTATSGYFMGRATLAALTGDTTLYVQLMPFANGNTGFSSVTLGSLVSGGVEQDVFTKSATQNYPIGTERYLANGRKFRYAQAGASNITRALMQQTAVADSKFLNITQTGHAQTAGATSITVLCTTGSGVAANYFAGGRFTVLSGTNIGDSYPIVSSTLQATDTLLDLVLGEPLRNNIAATDKTAVTPNRWKSTVVVPVTTATAAPAGVPLIDVTASYYYWAQTKGPAPMIVDTGDTLVLGGKAGIPGTNAVAGTAGVCTATAYAFPFYGTTLYIGVADQAALINLELE